MYVPMFLMCAQCLVGKLESLIFGTAIHCIIFSMHSFYCNMQYTHTPPTHAHAQMPCPSLPLVDPLGRGWILNIWHKTSLLVS